MKLFQVVLILSLVFILISYLRRFRRPALDKILVSLLLVAGIVFVINPDVTTKLAHLLGIGRGADLIFYLAMLGFCYIIIILYSKINKLEDQLTTLIRRQAFDAINLQKEKHD